MLSISKPIRGPGQGDYYLRLASTDDYYLDGEEPPGFWLGEGAEPLGLSGMVREQEFRSVFRGLSPDGLRPLVRNAGSARRRTGWDLTWSVPKSVSTAWSQAPVAIRREIETMVYRAVAEGIRYLEGIGMVTRRGEDGVHREDARLVFAAFPHSTSRALDPQLHVHTILLNVAVRPDGSTGTLDPREMFRHQHAADAVFRAELAAGLERSLGLRVARAGRAFEIVGVDHRLMETFSKRRKDILAELTKRGLSGARAAEVVAFATRPRKVSRERAELFEVWQQVGREHGWSTPEMLSLLGPPRRPDSSDRARRALARQAIEVLIEGDSHFALRDVTRALGDEAQGRGLAAADVHAVRNELARSGRLIPLGNRHHENRYTVCEMLELERDFLLAAEQLRLSEQSFPNTGSPSVLATVRNHPTLTEEQRAAVASVVGSAGGLHLVRGMAGTGKSFAFRVAHEIWQQQGQHPLAACVSGKAASGLQESTGIEAQTLHRLLHGIARRRIVLDASSVVLVDEAGMVGTRQLRRVVRACLQSGAKLVLVGDAAQLQAINAGGGFAALCQRHGANDLTEIQRQREPWARQAVRDFAAGRATKALDAYLTRDLVSVSVDAQAAENLLVHDCTRSGQGPHSHAVLASTNAEVSRLNAAIRERHCQTGEVQGQSIQVGADSFAMGDRVLFLRNHAQLGVFNGDVGTIGRVEANTLTVVLDGGREVQVEPKVYPHLQLGYALTTHKAQGMTVDDSFVLTGAAQCRELTYVQASRARNTTRFYVGGETLPTVGARMERSRIKELATDVAATSGPVLMHELLP